jgi:hypothetical protein
MASKSKSKQEEALQFLDDLDSLSPVPPSSNSKSVAPNSNSPPPNEAEAAEALAFLDEITQKSADSARLSTPHNVGRNISRSGTPVRKSAERVRVGTPGGGTPLTPSSSLASPSAKPDAVSALKAEEPMSEGSAAGWGWGSVWSSASAAIQQARTAVDEQVRNLPQNEQARKWSEGVMEYAKTAQLEKFGRSNAHLFILQHSSGKVFHVGQDFKRVGLSTLTDILNVVAPPISEHEVIKVWLSHDMRGYDGIESLVYRALARVCTLLHHGTLL